MFLQSLFEKSFAEVRSQLRSNIATQLPIRLPIDRLHQRIDALKLRSDADGHQAARTFYEDLRQHGLPVYSGNRALLVHFAPQAKEVYVAGDWNGWNPTDIRLDPVGLTGLFVTELRLSCDTRIGYQFVVDGHWVPDPANPVHEQVIGEHAILQMPAFDSGFPNDNNNFRPGTLDVLEVSAAPLVGTRTLYVYKPAIYSVEARAYPTIYFQDGLENLHRAKIPQLLDQLIGQKWVAPCLAVFIPHGGVARNQEYTPYFAASHPEDYRQFVVQTVVPAIDRHYSTLPSAFARLALGQSFGGTIVLDLGFHHPDVFECVAGQSGVYRWSPDVASICDIYQQGEKKPIRIYLDSTRFRVEPIQSQALARILEDRGYPFCYWKRPTAHSYESWKFYLTDILKFWQRGSA